VFGVALALGTAAGDHRLRLPVGELVGADQPGGEQRRRRDGSGAGGVGGSLPAPRSSPSLHRRRSVSIDLPVRSAAWRSVQRRASAVIADDPPPGAWASPAERTVTRRAPSAIEPEQGWTTRCTGLPRGCRGGPAGPRNGSSAGGGHGLAAPGMRAQGGARRSGKSGNGSESWPRMQRRPAQLRRSSRSGTLVSSGDRIRTCDLWVMSPASYRAAPPRGGDVHGTRPSAGVACEPCDSAVTRVSGACAPSRHGSWGRLQSARGGGGGDECVRR
jgi:hypothetical protein